MREKAHKLVGRRQKGEVKETEGGKILLHGTAGTWQIFGIAANKKSGKECEKGFVDTSI